MSEPRMDATEELIWFCCRIVWGGSLLFAKTALLGFRPLTIGVIRVIIGTLNNVTSLMLIDGGFF
ncbi:hypothetical protein N9F34_03380 [Alphaproteobacteria bacterium]|nr:hypothetical protein [Alphaproteobacteria bacterium]